MIERKRTFYFWWRVIGLSRQINDVFISFLGKHRYWVSDLTTPLTRTSQGWRSCSMCAQVTWQPQPLKVHRVPKPTWSNRKGPTGFWKNSFPHPTRLAKTLWPGISNPFKTLSFRHCQRPAHQAKPTGWSASYTLSETWEKTNLISCMPWFPRLSYASKQPTRKPETALTPSWLSLERRSSDGALHQVRP